MNAAFQQDHWARIIFFIGLIWVTSLSAAPELPIPAAGQFNPVPVSDEQPMPGPALLAMYRGELGARFVPAQSEALLRAHGLVEDYFGVIGLGQRRSIVKSIEALGVDAAVVGRLAGLRMHWAALQTGVYFVNEKRGAFNVRYFLGVPGGYDRTKSWPLVINLATPDPLLAQPPADAQSISNLYNGWVTEELAKHPDALVVIPLLDLNTLYGPGSAGMNTVIQAMQHAADRVNIDPARVYLVGQSLGAFAAWNLALHYPTYFAAFEALAGSARSDWQRARLMNLDNTLPIVWTDADDKTVRPDLSRSLVRSLKNLKVDVDFQETKGLGHTPTAGVLEDRYAKLRARTRPLYPEEVRVQSTRPETIFNRVDWVQLWQAAAPGAEHRVPIRRGGGFMTIYDNPDNIRATRSGNRIDVTADNVESFRLFLNDQMVDFNQPVTVTVNKKVKFEAKVTPSIEDMLSDEVFLGRGWRYYTAAIDIDVVEPPATNATTTPASRSTTQPARRGTITVGPGAAR